MIPGALPRRLPRLVLAAALVLGSCDGDDGGGGDDGAAGGDAVSTAREVPSQRLAPMPAPPRTEVVGAFWDG
ncbi:MAG TPA: hypothetical protein VI854_01985, partial [Acidimicrobiia bacterium]|nr:hypothetical protein [Acidimicrobiia bacterium]